MISVTGLRYSVNNGGRRQELLKDVSFDVAKGEKIAICGPSGSGKSTLLYVLGGLLQPESGTVRVGGEDIYAMNESDRSLHRNQNIGFIFQQFFLFPRRSVLHNVLLSNEYSPTVKPPSKAFELLGKLGIQDKCDRTPQFLSGGEQQRVAIARALLQDPQLILADEPTGSLDSRSAREVMSELERLNREGRTVVLITHDPNMARQCHRILWIEDGKLIKDEILQAKSDADTESPAEPASGAQHAKTPLLQLVRRSFDNLARHRMRSFLTLLGITVGVAAVISLLTIGRYAREKILNSYADLGIQNYMLYGYQNWSSSADAQSVLFTGFDEQRDLKGLKKMFPSIERFSPMMRLHGMALSYGGRTIKDEAVGKGVNGDGLPLLQREIEVGRSITWVDVEERLPVCVIGSGIPAKLMMERTVGELVFIALRQLSLACRVVGVMRNKSGGAEWERPNLEVYLPYSTLQALIGKNPYSNEGDINNVVFEAKKGYEADVEGGKISDFFRKKYGKSGEFGANSNSKLISQMNRFLSIFTILLGAVGGVTLLIGAVGVTNMMLVSVSERIREIGLRRALGASKREIRHLFLGEAFVISALAGVVGILVAVVFYQSAIWAAAQLFKQIQFEWIFDLLALAVGAISIVLVGFGAGLLPAFKAEKLQVIEALRADG